MRPRLPMPFEPLPPGPLPEPDAAFEVETVEETWQTPRPETPARSEHPSISPPPAPTPTAGAPRPHLAPAAPDLAAEALSSPIGTPPASQAPLPVAQTSLAAAPAAPRVTTPTLEAIAARSRALPKQPEDRSRSAPPLRLSQDEPLVPHVSPRPSGGELTRSRATSRPPGGEFAPQRERPIQDNAKTASTRPVASEIVRAAPIAPPPIRPVASRGERARRDDPYQREPAPYAEATVHVSIGRIEVRAAVAPARHERAKAASPVMSLEEYLRTRAGRARS